jgi:hypothetical protein
MILSWLPPLIFSVLVETGVDASWGMTVMGSFILIAAIILKLGPGSWDEILQESGRSALSEQRSHLSTPQAGLENEGNGNFECE